MILVEKAHYLECDYKYALEVHGLKMQFTEATTNLRYLREVVKTLSGKLQPFIK